MVVVGNSGAGKSTLAKALAAQFGLRHVDLDSVVFDPEQLGVMRPDRAIEAELAGLVVAEIPWVAEGSFGKWAATLSKSASHFFFLNPPLATCLAHHAARPWEPHKYPSPQAQAARLPMLEAWVRQYAEREDDFGEMAHRAAFDGAPCTKLEVSAAEEALRFLRAKAR